MPSMANITIKASDGTTNVVYNAATPSAGDKSPAVWRAVAANVVPMYRPSFSLVFRDNGQKTGRHVEGVFKYPIVVTENGVAVLKATVPMSFSGTLPTNVDASLVKEATYQFGNLVVNALIRQCFDEMYSAS